MDGHTRDRSAVPILRPSPCPPVKPLSQDLFQALRHGGTCLTRLLRRTRGRIAADHRAHRQRGAVSPWRTTARCTAATGSTAATPAAKMCRLSSRSCWTVRDIFSRLRRRWREERALHRLEVLQTLEGIGAAATLSLLPFSAAHTRSSPRAPAHGHPSHRRPDAYRSSPRPPPGRWSRDTAPPPAPPSLA